MILDTTSKVLKVLLGEAQTTALEVNVSWADTQSGATFVPGHSSTVTNGVTAVTFVAAPAASTQRSVKGIDIYNADNVTHNITVEMYDGTNTRRFIDQAVVAGGCLCYTDANGWEVFPAGGSSGSVTSVALTAPAIFSVTGSPITSTGTLALALATQAANLVWAGPASGSAATPTFRSLVSADIPSLSSLYDVAGSASTAQTNAEAFAANASNITSGTVGAARLPIATTTALGAIKPDGTTITVNASTGVASAAGSSGPVFSAANASAQSISSATPTKVTLGTVLFDTNSNFASSRFTPTVAGYYQLNGTLLCTDTVAVTIGVVYFYKNGANAAQVSGLVIPASNVTQNAATSGSTILHFNGTTDYVEMWGYIAGTAPSFGMISAATACFFSGAFLHP